MHSITMLLLMLSIMLLVCWQQYMLQRLLVMSCTTLLPCCIALSCWLQLGATKALLLLLLGMHAC